MWLKLFLIMLLTGCGASLRSLLLMLWPLRNAYLTGVFLVNLTGSFVLGLCAGLPLVGESALMIETGLLGGFTTFSSMMTESATRGSWQKQGAYLLLQIMAGFAAFTLGYCFH
ncbi:fluoride efflux transporter FluC [Fructobacillus papyrifericola]|uniref:Fluoride-specific ion channel FluC n=1 Tax=Fructobacillus papyrifericola TaxID=2713172 RepID=A0ABS5QTW9_9LACO|nr:CrcB family protein [Fructobacillus papyrifericola]MBS9336636.1 CrcB family protein [Fructobacillus papyrifericola]